MINKISNMLKNRKGFTLVELMVVVVIIGILAAIAVPLYNNVQERAEEQACKANLRTIDGMKTQWNMMSTAEQTAAGSFGAMFQGGSVPVCPADRTPANTYSNTAPTDTDKAECSEHGTW